MNRSFILLTVGLLLTECKQKSSSFEVMIGNYSIGFPRSVKQLPMGVHPNNTKDIYVDSTFDRKIEWLFNPYEFKEDTIYKLPDRRQSYGINIYLKNKGDRLDSVKTALEKQFKQTLLPMHVEVTTNEPHFGSAGYYCRLNDNSVLFLRKASCPQGDSWCQYNSLRIAIGYDLSKAEQERFATSYGQIWYSVD